jgi:hypothetical protein
MRLTVVSPQSWHNMAWPPHRLSLSNSMPTTTKARWHKLALRPRTAVRRHLLRHLRTTLLRRHRLLALLELADTAA